MLRIFPSHMKGFSFKAPHEAPPPEPSGYFYREKSLKMIERSKRFKQSKIWTRGVIFLEIQGCECGERGLELLRRVDFLKGAAAAKKNGKDIEEN